MTTPQTAPAYPATERLDLVQPWTLAYWRHPFMRDHWKYVDVAPDPDAPP
mgnify:CR=1 FL=1